MTVIAAAYDSETSYALAADSHGQVNGLRIPSVKSARIGSLLIGGTGSSVESQCGIDFLVQMGPAFVASPVDALRAMRVHILANTERSRDVAGLDSHFIAVCPAGVFVLGSDGGVTQAPDRWAVGAGEDIALGVMFKRQGPPWDVVALAVEAACALCVNCFGTATVLLPGEA